MRYAVATIGLAACGAGDVAPDAAFGTIDIVNASFEAPATAPSTFQVAAPPDGWVAEGWINDEDRVVGVLNPSTTTLYPGGAPDGDNVAVVFLFDKPELGAGLGQTLAATLQTSTRYELSVAVGNIAIDETPPHDAFPFDGYPGGVVELFAGDVMLGFEASTTLAEGSFERLTVAVTIDDVHPSLGLPLRIRLMNLDGPQGIEVNFDDVRLTASPAP